MQRCLGLAALGSGRVAPNPMVGALLVCNGRIIGEGYHKQFGGVHAEVDCLNSVNETDRHLIPESIMYVSLEPCAHFGKTPPCADRIIAEGIKHVVVACHDSFEKVNGGGIAKLVDAGIEVTEHILAEEATELNRRFFTYHEKKRPYIILKWAQSFDGFIAGVSQQTKISNLIPDILVHRWRAEEAAILVGRQTAVTDNPSLTVRHVPGKNPVRVLLDGSLKLAATSKIFDQNADTLILNLKKNASENNLKWLQIETMQVSEVLEKLYAEKLLSVLVEGGAAVHRSFLESGAYDEIRVITNMDLRIGEGVKAPVLPVMRKTSEYRVGTDRIEIFRK